MSTRQGPPNEQPRPTPPGAGNGGVPDWIALGGALLLVGGAVEILSRSNPKAGYLLATIIVLGAFASGNKLQTVLSFLREAGVIQ